MRSDSAPLAGRPLRLRLAGMYLALGLAWITPVPVAAQAQGQVPARPAGALVVPERFVRPWDPVTIFLDRDAGPAQGGPEDRPGRVVTLDPPQPGAWTWLDARTLQFRPSDPWPALTRSTWTVGGRKVVLSTLMAAPIESLPENGATDVDSPDSVALTFREPLDVAALSQMIRLELRPLPGLSAEGARWMAGDETEVKAVERRSSSDAARYVVLLDEPIPPGTRVRVHLRLALPPGAARMDDDAQSFHVIGFTTSLPFRVASVGCPGGAIAIGPSGTRLDDDQALACGDQPRVTVGFTSEIGEGLGAVEARNLVRFTPAVEGLAFESAGRSLNVTGRFEPETLYRVRLMPTTMADARGRPLEITDESDVSLHFTRPRGYLRWRASQGIVERLGPQRVPLEGRGDDRVDLRIHRIDPLDRMSWTSSLAPVVVDESERPPGPGEEPEPVTPASGRVDANRMGQHVAALGSPAISEIVELPARGPGGQGGSATFGLDLAPHLARISGAGRPGTYLAGIRRLDGSTTRSWMRVQVTDLCLTTVEELQAVKFVVTSLSKGSPVSGARVRVEFLRAHGRDRAWVTLMDETTAGDGSFRWAAPGWVNGERWSVDRIVVTKEDDTLVLDPSLPPDAFRDNFWSQQGDHWLQWTREHLGARVPERRRVAHLFTERPVYRPEETVHLKGWIRTREKGRLAIEPKIATLVVTAPGGREWRYEVAPTEAGGFYQAFHDDDVPTGTYVARLEEGDIGRIAEVSFRVEAYRIPRFQVRLSAPSAAPLDAPFEVRLSASYYAGGGVAGRPIQWRVTQLAHDWRPASREGFVFSSDARFSAAPFQSVPTLEVQGTTDDQGGATLMLDPSIEATASPRVYVVEATVTGEDDQTVTSTERIAALPPFVLGLKVPRYIERAAEVTPQVLVVGTDGEPVPGRVVTVRLLNRQWHSHLQEGDFSEGVARYVTDVVDEKVAEATVTSGEDAVPVTLALPRSGVYVVELEARDRLDRAQVVSADFYVGGDEPVAWRRPTNRVFTVTANANAHDPGDVARLVLQSPFQNAEGLVIVEAPDGNLYQSVSVRRGAGTVDVPIEAPHAPRLPVHVVLWRGRVPGARPSGGSGDDPGRPATVAATTWLEVNPVGNRVVMTLAHPERALPGATIDMKITLRDPEGRPVPGEVALWLVDQAVLALGREQRLDPVPDFLTNVASHLAVRDTRNLAFGELPFTEQPGGDGADRSEGLLDRVTVRRNFSPVPYYEPAIQVGPGGVAVVKIKLSDSLTNLMVRAKVASGPERFGHATGRIAVRLPVIVEPALPRFVRPGDSFVAAAIGRVVEGEGGAGRAEARLGGLKALGPTGFDLDLDPTRPARVELPVEVEPIPLDAEGRLTRRSVSLMMGIERSSDHARDAFEVELPIVDDTRRIVRRTLVDLAQGGTAALPDVEGAARAGSVRRSVAVTGHRGLLRLAAGLDLLLAYPYGCTEQRISEARARVALRRFRDVLALEGSDLTLARSLAETQAWIESAIDRDGLVAYWPGARGYVSLSAWVLQYLVEARAAGFEVDPALVNGLATTLERSLRSDWSRFIDGESWLERTWALSALAAAGRFNPAYAAELGRKAASLDLEGEAQVVLAFAQAGQASASQVDRMAQDLREGVSFRLHQGSEIYGGLQDRRASRSGLVLPSETRTLAQVVRALHRLPEPTERMALLVDALIGLGQGDGWGTTNASAEALLALSELLEPGALAPAAAELALKVGDESSSLVVGEGSPIARWTGTTTARGEARLAIAGDATATVRLETSWMPDGDGSQEVAASDGFVVTREILRIRPGGAPPDRTVLEAAATTQRFAVGDVIEERLDVVCPEERHFVAVVIPLAAGMEPLNPNLATAPPEARPSRALSTEPSYVEHLDDHVAFYYDTLPAGTHAFAHRVRATVPGRFVQPAALAEMMYDRAVRGTSNGARVEITRE